jgi:CheY-like chemotaxis protein
LKILLVEQNPYLRLSLSTMLGEHTVLCPTEEEDPIRLARSEAPILALIGLRPFYSSHGLLLCRALKTDLRPIPWAAILAQGPLVPSQSGVLGPYLADGYYIGAPQVDALYKFVQEVTAGKRPVVDVGAGFRDRLRRRFIK